MADVLNHYNITIPFPTEWPTEKDESDGSDDDLPPKGVAKSLIRRSRSRYSALERSGSDRRTLVPGSEKTGDGVENLVQKDEPDPLGGTDSVVRVLKHKGIPVEDDQRLRNRFLLSSTTFSPTLYLSQVHADASTQDLLRGLEYLSRSIDQKSASLKVLVESNFERFVRAKTTIDNVYAEMRSQGAEIQPEKTHSRVTSRSSTHSRNTSGQAPVIPSRGIHKPLPSDKKKNALLKESEYGVQGIKAPLIEVAVKAEEIWGPALGGREREGDIKLVMNSIERSHAMFEAAAAVSDCIRRKDYEKLVEEYSRAQKFADEARIMAENATFAQIPLAEPYVHQIVITGRIWLGVEDEISNFKREVWRKLTNAQASPTALADRSQNEEYMALISLLLELGVEDNPIWVWLLSRYDYLKNKISTTFERSRVEIEVLRRRLANAEQPTPQVAAVHLKSAASQVHDETSRKLDTVPVLELWELIYNSVNNLLSLKGGLLGEVTEFWDKAQIFIDGKVQKTLPIGIDGCSRKHHRLSTDGVRDLQDGAVELIDMLREDVFAFFADPPIEDISMLYSPLPPLTPSTPTLRSPFTHQDTRFKFDVNNPPPPSPRRGEAWEEFAFWPPYANSLSSVYYLEKLLNLLGAAASEVAGMRPLASGAAVTEKMKILVAGARERATRAVCAAWNRDAEMCKVLEDWTRPTDKRDVTRMPSYLTAFEEAILGGMQKILYIPAAAAPGSGSVGILSPPPEKLLHMVRSQFVASLYKALSGMVENAEKSAKPNDHSWEAGKGMVRASISRLSLKDDPSMDDGNRVSQGNATLVKTKNSPYYRMYACCLR